ncbi:MAG: hypothetical protein KatS3mg045_1929 [Bellilinea sp.]|nr:MAG: hypothetical protein KatS3mg045_1929 [Bellilinea sp.]
MKQATLPISERTPLTTAVRDILAANQGACPPAHPGPCPKCRRLASAKVQVTDEEIRVWAACPHVLDELVARSSGPVMEVWGGVKGYSALPRGIFEISPYIFAASQTLHVVGYGDRYAVAIALDTEGYISDTISLYGLEERLRVALQDSSGKFIFPESSNLK